MEHQCKLGAGIASDGLTKPASRTPWERAHLPDNTNMTGGVGDGRHDQPLAPRVAWLEAGEHSTQSHNVQLQHHVAFLEAQMIGQLGHIAKLETRVRVLESELSSLKANVGCGPNPVPASSVAVSSDVAHSVAACPVADSATPPPSPASAPAPDLHRTLPGQQHCRPTPPKAVAPGVVGNYALWDLRPKDADGSGTALIASRQGASGAALRGTMGQAVCSLSPRKAPELAANSCSSDVQADPSADPTSTTTAPVEPIPAVVAEQAETSSDGSSDETGLAASVTSRHPLHDFWVDESHDKLVTPPPASNTRFSGLRGASAIKRQRNKSSLPNGRIASDRLDDTAQSLEPVHNKAYPTRGAEEREPTAVARRTSTAEGVGSTEPTCGTVPIPVLRCATEGREGAEDRSSHLMDCASCQHPLPEDESIGRCGACPRSFCAQCLQHGLHEQGVDLGGLDQDCRAMLGGEKGDFFVEKCPHCIRGCDENFAGPSPKAVPMEHLLNELLRHDLSICFREPVDTNKHPDYVESIGRDAMMDLGTMLDKLKRKKYPRRRGPGQFLEDLKRIWRNCRRYAGCDELGQPHYGKTVPGIVRCALILEAMSIKFCAAYMSDNQGTAAWQESTWNFHREKQERINAEARLEQLKNQGKTDDNKKANPLASSGVDGEWMNVAAKHECREGSSSIGSAVEKSPGEENDDPTDTAVWHTAATDSSGGEGRKRKAVEMEGAAHTESSHSVTRATLDANGATSGRTRKTKLQRTPWSPLDKLCDIASTFQTK